MARHTEERKPAGGLGLHQLPGQLLVEEDLECERWYDVRLKWPEPSSNFLKGTKDQWADVSIDALSSSSRLYEKRSNGGTADEARRAIMKEKTASDKIAAYALAVQESPVYRLDELCTLLSYAQRKSRQERGQAIDALKDLFINDLLPDGRQLVPFQDRNFECDRKALSKRHLVYAWFESELKVVYREFLQTLENSLKDSLSFFKEKSVKTVFELLVAKPENEKVLLFLLVNKVGDPERRVASTASICLSKLIEKHHPQMRVVVVREVERMLMRPNVNQRTKYYAVNFLNNIKFHQNDTQLARDIVRIYMDLFTMCLDDNISNKEDEVPKKKDKNRWRNGKKTRKKDLQQKPEISDETKNGRLMAAILRGVNRAFPYTKPEQDDTVYDKYFNSLFRVSHAESFDSATQALVFLLQISQTNSVQNDRFYRTLYSRIPDANECSESTQAKFLNLLFKAMKDDTNPRRVKAFLKRLLQSGSYASAGFAGACLIVSSECFRLSRKGLLKSFVALPEQDDDEELFFDADKLNEGNGALGVIESESSESEEENQIGPASGAKRPFKARTSEHENNRDSPHEIVSKHYDPSKRDPKYSGAERTSLWEAVSLSAHFHPSVSLFAKALCKDMKAIETSGDPLQDFTLIAFLDRFCYKRTKNRVAKSLYGKRSSRYRDVPVANSLQFQELAKAGKLEENDRFFTKFFQVNPERVVNGDKIGKGAPDSGSEVDSEEEAFELALQEEMKRLGGEGDMPNGPDIDEEDEDELREFKKAFGNDIVGDDGDDGDEQGELANLEEVPNDSVFEINGASGTSSDSDGNQGDDEIDAEDKIEANGSVFAAAEEFEEAIEQELANAQNGNDSGSTESPSERSATRKRKRVMSSRKVPKRRRKGGK